MSSSMISAANRGPVTIQRGVIAPRHVFDQNAQLMRNPQVQSRAIWSNSGTLGKVKGVLDMIMGKDDYMGTKKVEPTPVNDGDRFTHMTLGEVEVVYLTVKSQAGKSRRIGPYFQQVGQTKLPQTHRRKHVKNFLDERLGFDHDFYIGGSPKKAVLALDFDGVIIDSVPESSEAAWMTAMKIWPEIFTEEVLPRKEQVLEQMRIVRPVVETGYENPVLIRNLLEGVSTDEILQAWTSILQESMEKWQLNRADLVHLFGQERDEWIQSSPRQWLARNKVWPDVRYALQKAVDRHEVYIVTTKQKRFVEKLLKERLFIDFPSDRIYDTSRGVSKATMLKRIEEKHPGASRYWFVEDKFSTLIKASNDISLRKWTLCLADWGYNTESEREFARIDHRLKIIDTAGALKLWDETFVDSEYREPNYQRALKPWETHSEDRKRLLELPYALTRLQNGEATEEDELLIETTPRRFLKPFDMEDNPSVLRL
eukprot:CAMPEP_0184480962 /NCGR_PEP_ID=MMETSP0113_2-20130426/2502_1 /TAXON_ID=91329 /ORGANISM="Norrisiella sphaerica, Strain BC52" /LENGTH=482 /DNA_ID=CAMNT_0026859803 /DNA_START=160 /DNA_END=1608 /DNA_ORIENTATION=-